MSSRSSQCRARSICAGEEARQRDLLQARRLAASCPFPPDSEHLKGQLALVTRAWQGPLAFPPLNLVIAALHLLLHTALKQATL